ncbi:hypothetical protein IW262DRAFT_1374225 [Armillaria fumosa]|nr:hypothetical protein IW262DRAFT_1374225 [Armillaria fumosa]
MTTTDEYSLTTLLPPTSYLLAYALPLLLLSLLLTFSGAFFTLDRTRQFPPRYDAMPGAFDSAKKLKWILEGGIGGLAIGYAFGLHCSTFLALLIPSITSSSTLSSSSFVAVWLLSSLLTTFLAGRWKYCALALGGISGGALFALALSVIIHPSLLTRIVFLSICTPIVTLFTLLPLIKFQHASLRFATASMGSFGAVVAIAALAHVPAWANVWERLWLTASIEWETSQEKGLSAGFCLFLCAGMASDWFLKRSFGECPDQKWDSYLADYAANLPNHADRAGIYQPFTSIWDRIFGSTEKPAISKDLVFPDDDKPGLHLKLDKSGPSPPDHSSFDFPQSPGYLKKARSKKVNQARFHALCKRNREAVKFRPLGQLESSDSEEDDLKGSPLREGRPWLKQRPSMTSTTPTLVSDSERDTRVKPLDDIDYDKEILKLGQLKRKDVVSGLGEGDVPEYSDLEEDLTSVSQRKTNEEWSPGFIKRYRSSNTPSSSHGTAVESLSPPTGAVPVAPSLMKALDRIALAQKEAFGPRGREGLPRIDDGDETREDGWADFWRDVRDKSEKS